ncbi:MAG: sugar transferase [bacterium]|nr:sugar transferase [bacterium]
MLKERLQVFAKVNLLIDLLLTCLSFILAFYLRASLHLPGEISLRFDTVSWLLLVIIPVWCILFVYEKAYDVLGERNVYLSSFKAIAEGMGILFAVLFFRRAYIQSRLFLVFFGVINTIFILLSRKVGTLLLGEQSVFIIGGGEKATIFYNFLTRHSPLKFKPIGTLELNSNFSDMSKLEYTISTTPIDWVVSIVDNSDFNLRLIELCKKVGIPISWAIPTTDARVDVEAYGGISFFTFSTAPVVSVALIFKYTMDRIIAFLLLLLTSPLFFLIVCIIKLSSKGSVFFIQERAGLNGKKFRFYKFRTMVEGAESMQQEFIPLNIMAGAVFKIPDDPRVTKLGKFLRRMSLDELPQLLNILHGDMSLVGPRPPLPSEIEKYERWQRRRLSMKPGLTCIWQVSGRNEIDFDKWMDLDLKYIDNWGIWLDFKILLRTIPAVISQKGAY